MSVRSLIDRLLGNTNYCLVETTFDLRSTGRYRFDFLPSVNEALTSTLPKGERGGVIVFSTDINALAGPGILNKAKAWYDSLVNRLKRVSKIQQALDKTGVSSIFSLGNFFRGRYKSQAGSWFDEKSLSLEVLGVTDEQLISLATELARSFKQESVLVKSQGTGEVYFVDGT
jgi:hypothetical protein